MRLKRQPCLHFNDHRLLMGFATCLTRSKRRPPNCTDYSYSRTLISSALSKLSRSILLSAFGPRDELAEGSPMWPHLLNTRMKAQTRRVRWPARRGFVKEHPKSREWSGSARLLSLSLGGPTALYQSFLKVLIERALYFITLLAR